MAPWRWLLLLAALGASIAQAEGNALKPRPFPQGPWQVRQVLIHEARTDRPPYRADDPMLVGRRIRADRQSLATDLPEARPCARPSLAVERMTLNGLLARTLLPVEAEQDHARAFGLDLPGATLVDVGWVVCSAGRFGPSLAGTPAAQAGRAPARTWFVVLPDGRALMRWYGDTVLVLRSSP